MMTLFEALSALTTTKLVCSVFIARMISMLLNALVRGWYCILSCLCISVSILLCTCVNTFCCHGINTSGSHCSLRLHTSIQLLIDSVIVFLISFQSITVGVLYWGPSCKSVLSKGLVTILRSPVMMCPVSVLRKGELLQLHVRVLYWAMFFIV